MFSLIAAIAAIFLLIWGVFQLVEGAISIGIILILVALAIGYTAGSTYRDGRPLG